MKHTPGPWRLTYSNYWIVGRDEERGEIVVAEMKAGGLSDAALIAAAPELLEALRRLLSEADSLTIANNGTPGISDRWPAAALARAAIANATGE